MSDYTEFMEYYKKHWEKSLSERTTEMQEEIKTLRAENARYREALEYISKTDTRDPETEDLVIWLNDWRNYTKQIARKALKGE